MSSTALLLLQGLGFFCFLYFLLYVTRQGKRPINMLSPGPLGFPVLGNLLQLGELPHRDLYILAKKHGPIMYMRFGFVPTIVVSSPQAAEQFLKAHDLVFANRPATEAGKYMSYGNKNLSFCEYGPYWRKIRKLCTLQLLSNSKIDCYKSMRKGEVGLLVESIRESAKAQIVVDLSAKLLSLTTNITCLMVFGRKYVDEDLDERGFDGVMREGMKLAAVFNLADYIPFVGVFDLQGLTKRMKAFSKVFDGFFEKLIDEHLRTRDKDHPRDFVDVLLSFMESNDAELKINRTNIKAIVLDLLAAGMETSSTTVEWALSDLLKHPEAMKKAQEELASVVGLDRIVEESDLPNLHYLEMVLKESMRLHPAVPLLLPHESMEDCTINGYHIPKKSRVIINAWAIGHDPDVWPNPEKFFPERFIGSNIGIRGHDFQLLPFGAGRRGCPGMSLGWAIVRLVLAQLLHCFNWKLPNGTSPHDLDMTEKFRLVLHRANHLLVFPTYRLNSH